MSVSLSHSPVHSRQDSERAYRLQKILSSDQLTAVFQPVAGLQGGTIAGYEGLIRGPADTELHPPLALFAAARQHGLIDRLDRLARETLVRRFAALALDGLLLLNVRPSELSRPIPFIEHLVGVLYHHGIDPHRVVLELTEHDPVESLDTLISAIAICREAGLQIAIDDFGAGYAGLLTWYRVRPDFVKIDRFFISQISRDPVKRQFFSAMQDMARVIACKVIAEGVETAEECEAVCRLGAEFVQGYYLARPSSDPIRGLRERIPVSLSAPVLAGRRSIRVGALARERPAIAATTPLNDVLTRFGQWPDIGSLAVVDQGRPVGLISRLDVMNRYVGYGRELHGRKAVRAFMNPNPLVSSSDSPIEMLSRRVTEEYSLATQDDFIVVDEQGQYLGMGTFVDLLQRITDLQIRDARHCNPLSQLPGNVPINERIDELLATGQPFTLAYCDLDNFKPFNDVFGYARGDEVILTVARLLQGCCDDQLDFVGHVGGDDFVVIFTSEDWPARCDCLLSQFARLAPGFYDKVHRRRGGIDAYDRQGRPVFYPFVSLSIGIVPAHSSPFRYHHEMARRASEVKHQAKMIKGNAVFVDRRREGRSEHGDQPLS